jgi:ribosome biogenesis GTPase A
MSITDTPGLLWPKILYDSDGFMLAASHAVGVNAVIELEVARHLAEILLRRYATMITARYGFGTEGLDGIGVIEGVAKKRGCILKGGRSGSVGNELDLDKASIVLLTDYRSGVLGRISLESPETRKGMVAAKPTQTY